VLTALNALPTAAFTLAQDLNTRGLQGWIQDNVVPLVLLGIAIILLWIGGRGDNAGVARRSVGLIVGLIALGIAVSGSGPQVGTFLAKLITG
jgi:Flp pilus assembly pilin Flp